MIASAPPLRVAGIAFGMLLAGPIVAGPSIELAADATRPAPNDLVKAVLYAEASGPTPGELARRVNGEIAEAIRTSKAVNGVAVKTGSVSSYPVYGKSRGIESWRLRSELLLESRDAQSIADLIGRLQAHLALASIAQIPSETTRKQVEDEATRDALKAFQARAAVVADALGKPYRIKQLSISQSGGLPPMPMLRAAKTAMAADTAPIPLEAGDSPVTVTISGQIELND